MMGMTSLACTLRSAGGPALLYAPRRSTCVVVVLKIDFGGRGLYWTSAGGRG